VTDFRGLLRGLAAAGVEFILVGGAAATAHGSARLTLDVDVVYRRSPENIARLVEPSARGIPICAERRRACRSGGTPPPSSAA
jgi:hypothetical protein